MGLPGMWKYFVSASFFPPRAQTLQRISGTAGQSLAPSVNDGIIWKHSSQYSGLMSIYLQGVCSSLPFYLSKHIWYPVAGASKRNVCFQRMPAVYLYSFVHSLYGCEPLCLLSELWKFFLLLWFRSVVLRNCIVCVLVTGI